MGSFSTIGVNDDFSSRETGISVGSTNHKLSGGVDMVFYVVAEQLLDFRLKLGLYPWNQNVFDIVLNFLQHAFFICVEIVMLGGDYNGIDSGRLVIVIVFNSHLCFGIGT